MLTKNRNVVVTPNVVRCYFRSEMASAHSPLMAGFTPVVVNRRSGRGLDRTQKVAIGAVAVSLAMIAIVTVQTRPGVSSPTALGMIQDMSQYAPPESWAQRCVAVRKRFRT